jgi:hypothetical protein
MFRPLTVLPAFVVIAVFVVMVENFLLPARSAPTEACFTEDNREHVRALTLAAIEQAFSAHVSNLYSVWLKDFSPEPTRATVGMANGLSAYHRARANAMQWNPPLCKE